MKKSKTGIPGFDELVKGGFPGGSTILVSGTPGTAKSIMSMQYIYNGARLFKEKSMYVSFEQSKYDIIDQAKQFGWNLEEYEKKGLLHLVCIPVNEIKNDTVEKILEIVKEQKIKRLVIDSISTISIMAPMYSAISEVFLKELVTQENIYSPSIDADFLLKRFIYYIIGELQALPVTSLLISEIGENSNFMSRDTISEFMCDGVIQMKFEAMGGEYSRSLLVRKMRQVKNDEDIHPVEIGKNGIVIHNME